MVAVTGLLCGCVSGSAPPAPGHAPAPAATGDGLTTTGADSGRRGVAPTEFSTVSEADVAEARSRLIARGVTLAELAEACGRYADNGWTYSEALSAASRGGPRRIAEVVAEVSAVAEEIALPEDWVASVSAGVDRPAAEWTEVERNTFAHAMAVRKSKLIEPLCAP